MNMNVDSKRIRAERERRAWSQQHLAEVAGVSLRTIQRVEATGLASYETAKAIAAVLSLDVASLRLLVPVPVPVAIPSADGIAGEINAALLPKPVPRRSRVLPFAATIALVTMVFFGRAAYADQVMLDVSLSMNDRSLGQHQLVAHEGKDAEIRVAGQVKVVVVPTAAPDGNIALSIRMYEFADDRFVLASEPKVLAADNDEVEVRVTSKAGNVFRIAVKPHKVE